MPSLPDPQDVALQRWAFANALTVAVTVAVTIWTKEIAWLLLGGGGALAWLVVGFRDHWTPPGRFGLANGLTAFRTVVTLTLPAVLTKAGGPALILVVVGLLLLDLLDGRIARRRGEDSAFGEYLDKETDALMLLLLCVMLYLSGRLGVWILLPGGLRYLFVLITFLGRPKMVKERRQRFARFVYALTVCALLSAFLPVPTLYVPLALAATFLLTLSFARSFWLFFSPS